MQTPHRLYSVKEAMPLLGLTQTTFYERVKEGKLLAVKSGRRTFVPETEITRFQAEMPAIGRGADAKAGGA